MRWETGYDADAVGNLIDHPDFIAVARIDRDRLDAHRNFRDQKRIGWVRYVEDREAARPAC